MYLFGLCCPRYVFLLLYVCGLCCCIYLLGLRCCMCMDYVAVCAWIMLLYVRGLCCCICKLYVDVCLSFISPKVRLKQRRRIKLGFKHESFSGPSVWVVITCEHEQLACPHILAVLFIMCENI